MPLFFFKCNSCGREVRKIIPAEADFKDRTCSCSGTLERDARGVTSRTVETLDNGAMTRSLERLTDAERLFKERNEATKKNQSGS